MLTLLRIGWLNLKRDRVAQALTFLLPIVFFSIFAACSAARAAIRRRACGSRSSTRTTRSSAGASSRRCARSRRCGCGADAAGARALDRAAAERLVRNGDVPVAVVIPQGLGAAFAEMGFAAAGPAIELLADPSDPIAPQMVLGLLQKVTMTAAPDLMMQGGMRQFEKHAGALTPQQRKASTRGCRR